MSRYACPSLHSSLLKTAEECAQPARARDAGLRNFRVGIERGQRREEHEGGAAKPLRGVRVLHVSRAAAGACRGAHSAAT